MRDLGTPVYSRRLFVEIISQFPDRAEFCVIRAGNIPVAAALLLHGWGITEVPSASSLRQYNHTCANMLMYWKLLERAAETGTRRLRFRPLEPRGQHLSIQAAVGRHSVPGRMATLSSPRKHGGHAAR